MTGLILAAGDGKRLFPDTAAAGCKPLLFVNGKRLLSYSLDNLARLGIKKSVIVVGRYADEIKETYGNTYGDIELEYARQSSPIGAVNAIVSAKDKIDEDIILQLSDEIFTGFRVTKEELSGCPDFLVGYVKETDRERIKGNFSIDLSDGGKVLRCTEKPETVTNDLKGTGFCFFSRSAVKALFDNYNEAGNRPADLCGFIHLLIVSGFEGRILNVAEREFNINTPSDLAYAKESLG